MMRMYQLLPQLKPQPHDLFSLSSAATNANPSADVPSPEFLRDAIFAAGRFGELEAAFGRVHGVLKTAAGYYGGTLVKPTYKEVKEGRTGHTEAIRVTYDKRKTSYKTLCNVFWSCHDPTNKTYLKFDLSTHYRSAIFYENDYEKKIAQETKVLQQMKLNHRIVTKIILSPSNSAEKFYLAETEHQKYYLQRDHIWLCDLLNLRSAMQFAGSHLACKLNGIFGGEEKSAADELNKFVARYELTKESKLVLEAIIHELEVKHALD